MLIGNDKKKRSGGYAVAIGALAMYGAYRIISGMKNIFSGGAAMMSNGMKKIKKKMPECCDDQSCTEEDSEPYDG